MVETKNGLENASKHCLVTKPVSRFLFYRILKILPNGTNTQTRGGPSGQKSPNFGQKCMVPIRTKWDQNTSKLKSTSCLLFILPSGVLKIVALVAFSSKWGLISKSTSTSSQSLTECKRLPRSTVYLAIIFCNGISSSRKPFLTIWTNLGEKMA